MIVPIVLSGGSGSRLWPVSRIARPKPFIKLADGQTLLEKTYRRVAELFHAPFLSECGYPEVLTVTNRDYYFMSRDEQDLAGINGRFLLEPVGRNTAPAVGMAAQMVRETYGDDALMLVMSADHLIRDQAAFNRSVEAACQLARTGRLVTFGIVPNAPETGFGYIHCGDPIDPGFDVRAFIEKPDQARAERFLATGNYLWNAGMFCFATSVFIDELTKSAPSLAAGIEACWGQSKASLNNACMELERSTFESLDDISIDYALMERSNSVAVVSADIGWSDIGSWNSLQALVKPDAAGNRAIGDVILVDSQNVFVQSEDRLVATVGVKDLIVVDTPDALLVLDPSASQQVKTVVSLLKDRDHETHALHRTVVRPWGSYTVLEESPSFKIKRIEVKPGASLSLQMHHHRSEHWVVVSGVAKVVNGDQALLVKRNESTYIPSGHKHRLENPGQVPCVLIEVQCGDYLGEDDIVRFEDSYGRA